MTKNMTKKQEGDFATRTVSEKNLLKSLYKYKSLDDISVIINKFGEVSKTRNGGYQYTCACHSPNGKQEGESIQVVKKSNSNKFLQLKYNILSKELKASCKFIIKSNSNSKFASNMCQTPMFFMNQLAIVLSGDFFDGMGFAMDDVEKR